MRKTTVPSLLLLALALLATSLLAPPASAAAQEAPAEEVAPPVFGDVVEVRVVNVEVVVTDRDGNRVHGLDPEDFRLFVDGEETPVAYFTEVVGGDVRTAGDAAVPGVPAAADDGTVGTSYLVFVDDFFSLARDRNQVLEDLRADLARLGPEDRMAIVAHDGERLEMLTSWTGSRARLEEALEAAAQRPAYGLQRLSELRTFARNARLRTDRFRSDRFRAAEFNGPFDVDIQSRQYARQLSGQVERSVEAAVAALRGFAMPEGRKVMLLLSGGWPFDPVGYAIGMNPAVNVYDVTAGHERLAPLVDTANLLGYTLYPVDVPGQGLVGAASAADVAFAEADGLARTNLQSDREYTLEHSLRHVARKTGGQPLINAQSHEALERVSDDTRSYYWLGFAPDRQRDDRRHDIRVELDRRDLKVRTRESFLDMSPDTERTLAVESALLFGEAAARRLIAEAGNAQRTGRRTMSLPVELIIPGELINAVPVSDDTWVAQLELRVAALDARNQRSDVPSFPIELHFDDQPAPGAAFKWATTLQLRRIDQEVVLHVTDPVSGHMATAQIEVDKVE